MFRWKFLLIFMRYALVQVGISEWHTNNDLSIIFFKRYDIFIFRFEYRCVNSYLAYSITVEHNRK